MVSLHHPRNLILLVGKPIIQAHAAMVDIAMVVENNSDGKAEIKRLYLCFLY